MDPRDGSVSHSHNDRNRNRRRRDDLRKDTFVAGLSPEGQINKVIAEMNSLEGGYDLRNWSPSARKDLLPTLTITLEVDCAKKPVKVEVPKLALLVASPSFRAHMVQNLEAKKLGFTHKDISLGAVKTIAKWLRDLCNNAEFPIVPVSDDLNVALELRLTAYRLGMHQYVGHIEERYISGVEHRVPSLVEIATVTNNTREEYENDPIVVALANRLSYLCRHHKVSQEVQISYANLLAEEKFDRILRAVQENKVMAVSEGAEGTH
ncbi:uncharacterized protein K460DRAFT_289014 [Cucurbitaria berberidis CBS 394.84]|uniref:BTB domain-containing protein n=1 Tax=Cucurbitaria berberidis CBS 394.84 TaxID=1168544 RepID=A0A9P4GCF7_9PLEO|nr:uncharacterized protein K460DRAFT_289014 [Cucurbitaria berberidis CBS 394.84]KAF1842954.1 hypothetical protein K460DRAFT_289014 [Cucurbitaria berberidis CBS 394.84]